MTEMRVTVLPDDSTLWEDSGDVDSDVIDEDEITEHTVTVPSHVMPDETHACDPTGWEIVVTYGDKTVSGVVSDLSKATWPIVIELR